MEKQIKLCACCGDIARENKRLREGLDDLAKALWLLEDKGFIGTDDEESEAECSLIRHVAQNAVQYARGLSSGLNVGVEAPDTAPRC